MPPLALSTITAVVLGVSLIGVAADEPSIYRCTGPDGHVEFRQIPCHSDDKSAIVEIEDRRSGWTPPQPSEVSADPRTANSPVSKSKPDSAVDRRRAEKCWQKEQRLEDVKRQLRAGYKASTGDSLRAKRREYADYLKRFCRD